MLRLEQAECSGSSEGNDQAQTKGLGSSERRSLEQAKCRKEGETGGVVAKVGRGERLEEAKC